MCGVKAKLTREHAIPDWIEGALPGAGDFTTSVGDLWSKTAPVLDQKIKRVCESCNTGWMHKLEDACIPVLRPAIRLENAPFDIAESDQCNVALWAVKTAYMLEFMHGDEPHVPAAHYRHIYSTRKPPLGCMVWLAAYIARDHLFHVAPKKLYVRNRRRDGHDGYLTTFSIGHLAMQVAYLGGSGEMQPLREPPILNRIWPVSGPQRWPAGGAVLDSDCFLGLCRRFGG
jgi:hypothetical protein